MDWARAPQKRDQIVLFPTRLDEAIGQDHHVRLLDDILSRLDWTKWESSYDLRRGQPPIHPRILAGVILYGLLVRTRSSRALEEALYVRLDFRWLVEGRSIDHTTISEFRRKNAAAIKDTFVQIGMVAREMGCLQGSAKRRMIYREQHETLREAHAAKMSTEEANKKYSRRRHPGERPFAVTKHVFGARRFLLRGLDQVKQEWQWLATAFNLSRLIGLSGGGTGPPPAST